MIRLAGIDIFTFTMIEQLHECVVRQLALEGSLADDLALPPDVLVRLTITPMHSLLRAQLSAVRIVHLSGPLTLGIMHLVQLHGHIRLHTHLWTSTETKLDVVRDEALGAPDGAHALLHVCLKVDNIGGEVTAVVDRSLIGVRVVSHHGSAVEQTSHVQLAGQV